MYFWRVLECVIVCVEFRLCWLVVSLCDCCCTNPITCLCGCCWFQEEPVLVDVYSCWDVGLWWPQPNESCCLCVKWIHRINFHDSSALLSCVLLHWIIGTVFPQQRDTIIHFEAWLTYFDSWSPTKKYTHDEPHHDKPHRSMNKKNRVSHKYMDCRYAATKEQGLAATSKSLAAASNRGTRNH